MSSTPPIEISLISPSTTSLFLWMNRSEFNISTNAMIDPTLIVQLIKRGLVLFLMEGITKMIGFSFGFNIISFIFNVSWIMTF